MSDLTILVPSYDRPRAARELARTFQDTCTADTKLVFVCNSDDSKLGQYFTMLNGIGRVLEVPSGRRGMCDSLHAAFSHLKDDLGFAVGFMGDDHRPRTIGWDAAYLNVLYNLGTGFVYGNDLLQGELIPTQVAMTSDIPQTLGYMVPREFQHLFVDNVWKDWGRGIGKLVYLDDVVVEHLHPLAGKAKSDKNYRAVNSGPVAHADGASYAAYHSSGRLNDDIARLKLLLTP